MKTTIAFATLITLTLCLASGRAQTLNRGKLDRLLDRLAEKNKGMGSVTIAKDGTVAYTHPSLGELAGEGCPPKLGVNSAERRWAIPALAPSYGWQATRSHSHQQRIAVSLGRWRDNASFHPSLGELAGEGCPPKLGVNSAKRRWAVPALAASYGWQANRSVTQQCLCSSRWCDNPSFHDGPESDEYPDFCVGFRAARCLLSARLS